MHKQSLQLNNNKKTNNKKNREMIQEEVSLEELRK
jgi:hypothetical protein